MTDNYLDINFVPEDSGWIISVSYWYYNRNNRTRKMTSVTTYTWYTECKEIVELLQKKKTKVFFSQIRVLARTYGKRKK